MKHNSSHCKFQNHEIQSRGLLQHFAGGVNDHGVVLHHHPCPFDDPWVVHHRPTGSLEVSRWLLLSFWSSIQCSPWCSWRSIWCNSFLWCVCWDPMNCEFMIRSIYEHYLSLCWTLLCMIVIASYFFSDLFIWFGQLDWFILPREEVLCDGFGLALLNLSDRKRHDTHVSLLLRVKSLVLFIVSLSCLHHVILLKALLRFSWT